MAHNLWAISYDYFMRILIWKILDHDGDDVETETFLEDEKVTLICTGKPYGPLKTVREILPDGTLKVHTILTDLNVSCYRLFKRE